LATEGRLTVIAKPRRIRLAPRLSCVGPWAASVLERMAGRIESLSSSIYTILYIIVPSDHEAGPLHARGASRWVCKNIFYSGYISVEKKAFLVDERTTMTDTRPHPAKALGRLHGGLDPRRRGQEFRGYKPPRVSRPSGGPGRLRAVRTTMPRQMPRRPTASRTSAAFLHDQHLRAGQRRAAKDWRAPSRRAESVFPSAGLDVRVSRSSIWETPARVHLVAQSRPATSLKRGRGQAASRGAGCARKERRGP